MSETPVSRAMRLFEFLARSQQLKSRPPQSVDSYESVLWFGGLPEHSAVTSSHRDADPESGRELLAVERVPPQPPPEPEPALRLWVDGALDDFAVPPRLRESVDAGERLTVLDDVPEVYEAFQDWLACWSAWAERERVDTPARAAYNQMFATYVAATGHAEELELVVGVGCLSWSPTEHDAVRRHLITVPAAIHFDDDTGRLGLHQAESSVGVTVELDMLDPGLVANPQHVTLVKADAHEVETPVVHRDVVGGLARRLAHALNGDSLYLDEDDAPKPMPRPVVSFAPALILRKRSKQGLVDILDAIAGQLAESGVVPDGLLPLVNPDHRPAAVGTPEPGALVQLDDDPFLPLPVNDVQLRILKHVDTKAQTLVQGPPGTGKTHTAAALLSHLLAQGKRVLVTAHTDRALKEVRAKLPAPIAPLAVSVVGSSRSDMSELKVAVERINHMAGEYDADTARRSIQEHLEAIDGLRRHRAALHRRLLDARRHEVGDHEIGSYRGTLAAIAQRIETDREQFGWLANLVIVAPGAEPPVDAAAMVDWHRSLIDDALNADEADSRLRLLAPSNPPVPEAFVALVAAERAALSAEERLKGLQRHPAFGPVRRLDQATRNQVRQRLNQLVRSVEELSVRREDWVDEALLDVRVGRASIWQSRGSQIAGLVARVGVLVDRLGPVTGVAVVGGELGALVTLASGLREHVIARGKLKTNPDGSPRSGAFAPSAVKQAQALFQSVRVNGVPPTTEEQLDAFLTWAEATRSLEALDKAWPDSVVIPAEDTLRERLQWHETELAQLRLVLALSEALADEERGLAGLGLPRPDWSDLNAVRTYSRLVDAAAASDMRAAAAQPLIELARTVDEVARWSDAAPCVQQLAQAIRDRDHESYAAACRRLVRLVEVRRAVARRDEVTSALVADLPDLCTAVSGSARDQVWSDRLSVWDAAWAWASTRAWVLAQEHEDINTLQAEVSSTEEKVRDHVEQLAAVRAWSHAVSPQRLSGKSRADLQQYAQLVKGLGKGTGRYAEQRRAEIREAMDRCRPAVPVWIMPIYRIAEQLRVQPNMFDVVIVDEASQAGLEATFLQYLAPKIVVIGDDKQVSPTAVGIDQQQLRDLADQYLWDDPYRASWQDPKRSLFDEAKMRFEGLLTLTEHRRCVPEIIGFSNRIAYEPDGIRLVPVRQYGADRLEPVKPVFLADGYERGMTGKVNPVEVDAIVDQIEKCIADPRYDGLTFGVVSLLGRAQANVIEKRLLERVQPEEWAARELRCGDSADFQGSERNVMFLSMVKAAEPGRRIGALTQDQYVQRFNVAASRAKDQMWVFHSIRPSDLGNPEDMRFQLLDYCYGVTRRADSGHGTVSDVVPEDRRVGPFDSLFEQRVFNRLVDRGYTVIPQYPAQGYRVDLVVVGAKIRLAVECDGDAWHGPDRYEQDLARQRDLERCGWRFFRIRESEFYADRPTVLARLWNTLQELDIHPSGWVSKENDRIEAGEDPMLAPTPEAVVWPSLDDAIAEPVVGYPGIEQPVLAVPAPVEQVVVSEVVKAEVGEEDVSLTLAGAPVAVGVALAVYETFDGGVVPVGVASQQELIDGLERLVGVEGPVLGQRLHSAYVRASGGQRVGKLIATELNKAITQAVREGRLVEENPLGETGVKPCTYRLPNQPAVRVRYLGPRPFEEIPPKELAALVDDVAEGVDRDDEEALSRAVLEMLGLQRLTDNVKKRLATVQFLRS